MERPQTEGLMDPRWMESGGEHTLLVWLPSAGQRLEGLLCLGLIQEGFLGMLSCGNSCCRGALRLWELALDGSQMWAQLPSCPCSSLGDLGPFTVSVSALPTPQGCCEDKTMEAGVAALSF